MCASELKYDFYVLLFEKFDTWFSVAEKQWDVEGVGFIFLLNIYADYLLERMTENSVTTGMEEFQMRDQEVPKLLKKRKLETSPFPNPLVVGVQKARFLKS